MARKAALNELQKPAARPPEWPPLRQFLRAEMHNSETTISSHQSQDEEATLPTSQSRDTQLPDNYWCPRAVCGLLSIVSKRPAILMNSQVFFFFSRDGFSPPRRVFSPHNLSQAPWIDATTSAVLNQTTNLIHACPAFNRTHSLMMS